VTAAILILVLFSIVFRLVFFKFKWLKLTPGWGIISAFFVLHVLLVFVIGPGFVTICHECDGRSAHHPDHSAPS